MVSLFWSRVCHTNIYLHVRPIFSMSMSKKLSTKCKREKKEVNILYEYGTCTILCINSTQKYCLCHLLGVVEAANKEVTTPVWLSPLTSKGVHNIAHQVYLAIFEKEPGAFATASASSRTGIAGIFFWPIISPCKMWLVGELQNILLNRCVVFTGILLGSAALLVMCPFCFSVPYILLELCLL